MFKLRPRSLDITYTRTIFGEFQSPEQRGMYNRPTKIDAGRMRKLIFSLGPAISIFMPLKVSQVYLQAPKDGGERLNYPPAT